jgi:hypothetical protein
MKKIRGEKPIGVIYYKHMEISQGNSLCRYLYLKKQKCHFISFLSFLFFLQQNRPYLGRGRVGTSGRVEVMGKAGRRVNMLQIICTSVCK